MGRQVHIALIVFLVFGLWHIVDGQVKTSKLAMIAQSTTASCDDNTFIVNSSDSVLTQCQSNAWVPIGANILSSKGDILTYSTSPGRLPVGADNLFLKADSSQATGLVWAAQSAPALVYAELTSSSTISSSVDVIIGSTAGGGFTITFPAAASNEGECWHIYKEDTSSNQLNLDGNSSETVLGQSNINMSGEGDSLFLCSDGSNIVAGPGQDLRRTITITLTAGSPYTCSTDPFQACASVTNLATGRPRVSFVSGFWSTAPQCTCSPISALDNDRYSAGAWNSFTTTTNADCYFNYTDDQGGSTNTFNGRDNSSVSGYMTCTGER